MNVKKLLGITAWVLFSAAFMIGPLLQEMGAVPEWASLLFSLIPSVAIIFLAFNRIRSWQSKILLFASFFLSLYLLNQENLLRADLVYLCNFSLINGLLFWIFARTLFPKSVPLCTRFADLVHEKLSPAVVVYTRALTIAWAIFFAIQIVLWFALYFTLSAPVWYQLISVAPPFLIATMFVIDWIARQYALPYEDRKNALSLTITALIKHRQSLGKTISK